MRPSHVRPALALALATAIFLAPAGVRAQGLETTRCDLQVRVVDGIASTRLTLTVRNPAARIAEADWVLPLPEGAVADHLETTIDGVEARGEVLDAAQARGVYEQIVRRKRDPALLEHFGRGCLRARLFPIPARGEAKIEIGWRQVLPELGDLARWSFPAATCGPDGATPALVVLDVAIESSRPIRNVLAPTPGIEILRPDDHHVRASCELPGNALRTEPLALLYGLSEAEFGLHALTFRRGTDDGHFVLLLSPKRTWPDQQVLDRSIVFVVDTSGSMKGEKIEQAKAALRQFVASLRPTDRFDIVTFSTEARSFFGGTQPADAERVADALQRIERIEAAGGTNFASALESCAPDRGPAGAHVPIVVLATDGLPSVGTKDPTELTGIARKTLGDIDARIFVLGVGHDLDAVLLDRLADETRGTRQYVRPGENIEEKASDLFDKLSSPVLTDLTLQIDGAEVSRMVPAKLPDLFVGSRLLVAGRYAKPGHFAIRLCGRMQGVAREYVYEADFAAADQRNDFVPVLWAERRVATLLDAIRLNGQDRELVDEVKALGTEYRIVTPFTSHLIVEEGLAGPIPSPGGGGSVPARRGGHPGGTYRGPGDVQPPGPGGPSTPAGVHPGPAGPATPGPAGPAGPGTAAGPTTGGGIVLRDDEFYLGAGRRQDREAVLGTIAERLRAAGVLPRDATDEAAKALAAEVAREMLQSAQELQGLGARSGTKAVDDSVWLAQLMSGARRDESKLLDLFSRRIGDRVFLLREGVWTDRTYDAGSMAEKKRVVEAFSPEYFDLVAAREDLRACVALSTRLIVVLDDLVLEIRPPAPSAENEPATTGEPAGNPPSGGKQG
ncbi:MAG: VWA domain-containing protein [Planctomycetes bacterium]|nr:VWA domain-containing protein [Planctomycetota bacterium]